ncbi:MAG: helix-turn-helix transcriptional regulator [Sphingopyxis sp.]|nr:helix-turn-helix transcriptional regulator [Sphingopyxis sp.]
MGKSQDFSSRFREERIRVSPKQLKFAELSGIDNTLVSALENGRQLIRAEHLARAAEAGVDVLYVVTGQRSGALISDSESRLLDLFRSLGTEAQAAVLVVVGCMAGDMPQSKAITTASIALHDGQSDYKGEK